LNILNAESKLNINVVWDSIKNIFKLQDNQFPMMKYTINILKAIFEYNLHFTNRNSTNNLLADIMQFFSTLFMKNEFLILLTKDEDYRIKYAFLSFLRSLIEKKIDQLSEKVLIVCFSSIMKLSETNILLHDITVDALSGILELMGNYVIVYKEDKNSIDHQIIKTYIEQKRYSDYKESGNSNNENSNTKTRTAKIPVQRFRNFKIDNLYDEESVSIILWKITNYIGNNDSKNEYLEVYHALISILCYCSEQMTVKDISQNRTIASKLIALKVIHGFSKAFSDQLKNNWLSLMTIISDDLFFNLTSISLIQLYTLKKRIENLSSFESKRNSKNEKNRILQIKAIIDFTTSIFSIDKMIFFLYEISDLNLLYQPLIDSYLKLFSGLLLSENSPAIQESILSFVQTFLSSLYQWCNTTELDETIYSCFRFPLVMDNNYLISQLDHYKLMRELSDRVYSAVVEKNFINLNEVIIKFPNSKEDIATESVGEYLFLNSGISSQYLGAFLINKKGLKFALDYLNNFKMKGIPFVDAFRLCLGKIRLTGETSDIEKYAELIAEAFLIQNKDSVVNYDDSLKSMKALAVSGLLLNVNHHSGAQSKQHVPLSQKTFISLVKSIQKDTPLRNIIELYEDIRSYEILLPSDQPDFIALKYNWDYTINAAVRCI
ncbi:MAG: G-box binding factor, partial [Paramarteilia canceri]